MRLKINDAQLRKIVKETTFERDVSCGGGLVLRIRGDKRTWRVSFGKTDPNTKKKKHLTATLGDYPNISLSKASQLADEKILELRGNFLKVKEHEYTFNDLKDEWLEDLLAGGTSKKRIANIKTHLNKLSNFGFLDKKINSVTTDDFIDYTNWAKSRNDSVVNIKLTLKNLLQFIKYISSCNRCNYTVYSNLKALYSSPKYKVAKSEGYAWQPLSKLCKHMFEPLDNKDLIVRAGILLVALTGLRLNSAISMRWDWIDLEKKIITIPKDYMKIKHDFVLPITNYMAKFFTNWRYLTGSMNKEYLFTNIYKEKAYSKSKYEVPVTQCCKDITLHGFRKTFETWFAENCSLLNIRYDISDIILDHSCKNGRSYVATQCYDKALYIQDKLNGLTLWQDELFKQLSPGFKELLK